MPIEVVAQRRAWPAVAAPLEEATLADHESSARRHGEPPDVAVPAARARNNGPEHWRARLQDCLAAPPWVDALLAAAPYRDAAGWLAAGDTAFRTLSDADVLAAVAAHPRIGAAPTGAGRDAAASRREQAAVTAAGDDVRADIADGNRRYEERFGRVFLIRAAGREPAEILAELRRRLRNDDATEWAETREQLRQITLRRLEQLLTTTEEDR